MQPQGHVQVLLNILRGFNPQAALDAPRFCISAGLPDAEVKNAAASAGDVNSEVYIEEGIPDETVDKLRGPSPPSSLALFRVCGLMMVTAQRWATTPGRRSVTREPRSGAARCVSFVVPWSRTRVADCCASALLRRCGVVQVIQQLIDKESGRRVWAAGSDLRGDG